jgi:hypothetical protein
LSVAAVASPAIFLGIAPENLSIFDFSDPVLTTAGAFYVRAPVPEPESPRMTRLRLSS